MRRGRLRESIIIQQKTNTVSDSGSVADTWTTFTPGYADIATPSGREFFSHAKYNAEVTHVVEIRWITGINEQMRVLWGTRILNIVYISEDGKHARSMWLNCVEAKD